MFQTCHCRDLVPIRDALLPYNRATATIKCSLTSTIKSVSLARHSTILDAVVTEIASKRKNNAIDSAEAIRELVSFSFSLHLRVHKLGHDMHQEVILSFPMRTYSRIMY